MKLQSRNRFHIEEVNIDSLLWNILAIVVAFKKITYSFSKWDSHEQNQFWFPFRSSKVLLCYFEDEESTPENFLEAPRVKNPCSYENIPNLWCPKIGSTIQLR